jgi:hypothetical protein
VDVIIVYIDENECIVEDVMNADEMSVYKKCTDVGETSRRLRYVVCLKSKCTDFPMDELVM